MNVLLVFVGGGTGAVLRYGVALVLPQPWATQLVNVLGSAVLAWLVARTGELPQAWRLGLGTGLCGGFTTYSTFNQDTLMLLAQGRHVAAVGNVLLTLFVCLGAGAAGFWFGSR